MRRPRGWGFTTTEGSRLTAILDACVLYPARLRELLVELARTRVYHARWTDHIHDEWISNVLQKHAGLRPESLIRTRLLLNEIVEDSLIEARDYEPLIAMSPLPDPDDRHVLAAARAAGAVAVVTFNLRDFPEHTLEHFGIVAVHPDEFIMSLMERNFLGVFQAAQSCQMALSRPPMDADEYLDRLARQVPQTAAYLRPLMSALI